MTNMISIINIVTATEKAEKIHPTISETIGITIAKIRQLNDLYNHEYGSK